MPNITPDEYEYIANITSAEVVYNAFAVILSRLIHDPGINKHQIIKVVYPFTFGGPHQTYISILNQLLEEHEYPWRVHSSHIRIHAQEKIVILLLRRESLVDLTDRPEPVGSSDKLLWPLMQRFAAQQGKLPVPPTFGQKHEFQSIEWDKYLLPSPSCLTIYQTNKGSDYYYHYRMTFDIWEYNEEYPEIGWQLCVYNDQEKTG